MLSISSATISSASVQTQTLHGEVDLDVLSHMLTNSSIPEVLLAFASNDKYNSFTHQSPLLLPRSFTLSESMSQFPERHKRSKTGDCSDLTLCCRILRAGRTTSHSYCRLARYTRFLVLCPIEIPAIGEFRQRFGDRIRQGFGSESRPDP